MNDTTVEDPVALGSGLKHTIVDGVDTWTASQTWINTFMKCPEQARLKMHGLLDDHGSDATAIGHGLHAGIECSLRGGSPDDAFTAAEAEFTARTLEEGFVWAQVKTVKTAVNYLAGCLTSWYTHVRPQLWATVSIEHPFKVELDRTDRGVLMLTGTWDLEDDVGLWDWKTANQPYEQWQVSRYYVQPTVYCYGRSILRGNEGLDESDFTYAVMPKAASPRPPQVLPVTRGPAHYDWLRKQLWSIVDLWQRTDGGTTGSWPLIDQGWHCSPKWCAAYADCKGVPM